MKSSDLDLIQSKKAEGFRVYKLKEIQGNIIAKKGGPTKKQIQKSPAYQPLRNNQREFGMSSVLAKAVRHSLPDHLGNIGESYVSAKLTALFRKIIQMGSGEVGKRPLMASQHGKILKGFEFNSKFPFKKIFKAKFLLKPSSNRGHFIFHFPSYVPQDKIVAPQGATHFKFFSHLVALSDFDCNNKAQEYRPLNPEQHTKHATLKMSMRPLCRFAIEPATTHISINNGFEISNSALVLIVGVQFYKYHDTRYEEIKIGNSMQIYEIF